MGKKLSCREIFENLSAYIDAELDSDFCDEIEEHLEGCNPCVSFLETLKKTAELYRGLKAEGRMPNEVRTRLHDFLRRECAGEGSEEES